VRFEWTPEGYVRVVAQNLDPGDVHEALRAPGRDCCNRSATTPSA
jgi:hypothetical protein